MQRFEPSFATSFATSFAEATEVKESYGGQRKLRSSKKATEFRKAEKVKINQIIKRQNNMEAILKFTLPEEQYEFLVATKAISFASVINEFDSFLRSKAKYEGINELGIDELREKLRRLCEENNVASEVFEM